MSAARKRTATRHLGLCTVHDLLDLLGAPTDGNVSVYVRLDIHQTRIGRIISADLVAVDNLDTGHSTRGQSPRLPSMSAPARQSMFTPTTDYAGAGTTPSPADFPEEAA